MRNLNKNLYVIVAKDIKVITKKFVFKKHNTKSVKGPKIPNLDPLVLWGRTSFQWLSTMQKKQEKTKNMKSIPEWNDCSLFRDENNF